LTTQLDILIAAAEAHCKTEEGKDVDAILATMEGEPVYEFHPVRRVFRGMERTRRYYEHLVNDVQARMSGFRLYSQSVGNQGMVQEYNITITHEGDTEPSTHRIMVILTFGERGISGERMYSDERLFRTMLGPLWDETEALELDAV